MRMRHCLAVPALIGTFILGTVAFAGDDAIVAKVNDAVIRNSDVDDYISHQNHGGGAAPDREQVTEELIARELVYQDAVARHLAKSPEFMAEMENYKRETMLNLAVRKALEEHPVSDEEIAAYYKRVVASAKHSEYKARHILVDSEAKATSLIAQLDKGASFADLAKKNSTDSSAKEGGELGWFMADQMVPPFSEAVQSLSKGSYTKKPVQTQFGWHVILLEDTRTLPPPSLEQVHDQISGVLQRQQMLDYISGLRAKAKIEIMGDSAAANP
jgi:peptidyl-prolyl cis-trans isomerase C